MCAGSHLGGLRDGDNKEVTGQGAAERIRGRIGVAIFERVAGSQGPSRARLIRQAPGERWFAQDRPIRRVLAAAAVSLLPGWARRPLYLPRLPVTETMLVRPAGHAMVRAIRWATSAPPATRAS